MKAVVAAFNQEKALVGAFSVITNLRMQLFEALISGVIGKAKIKTVKITGILVLGFVLCWTPYNLMYVW